MDRAVRAERERGPQRLVRLRRPHRHRDDLVSETDGVGDCVGIEPVQLERHAFAHE